MVAHEAEGDLVNLASLSVQQLSQVKKQIDEELDHLTQSLAQLHAVQGKFSECLRIVNTRPGEQPVLVPLTSSLYASGFLSNSERVIVDVGTGYYIEKEVSNAERFYEAKVQQLALNIQSLEKIIQRKTTSARGIENALHKKVSSN